MPSYTITGTTEQFARMIASLEDMREEETVETDRQLYLRWLKGVHTERVFKMDRRAAQGAVAPDNDIVEVT